MIRILLFAFLLPVFCSAQSIENLDIKNGFLQFKLGDSISNFKTVITPNKVRPGYYEVKLKTVKLKRNIQKLTLFFENGTLSSIEVSINDDSNVQFMEDALKKSYGDGNATNSSDANPAHQTSYVIWTGKRVAAIFKKDILTFTYNNVTRSSSYGTLTIKKTSDLKIDGQISSDFLL